MAAKYDYEEILQMTGGERPVHTPPPPMVATKKLMRIIEDAQIEHETPEAFADWFANYLEGYGARTAEGVFTLDGCGPVCSWCGCIWPLCGHDHMSDVDFSDGEDTEEDKKVA